MALSHLPLSGNYPYHSIEQLLERLHQASSLFPTFVHQSAYLLTREGPGAYGMNPDELAMKMKQAGEAVQQVACWVCQSNGEGIWVRLNLVDPLHPEGRFLISTNDPGLGRRLRAVLLNEPELATPQRLEEANASAQGSNFSQGPAWEVQFSEPTKTSYHQPTIRLSDGFHFSPQMEFEDLVKLTDELSQRYLGGALFYLKLETSDGDYYHDLSPHELRYFFERRREKLWLLHLESESTDGQSVYFRFWFHPLLFSPNALVYITSYQADEILTSLHQAISIAPPSPTEPLSFHHTYEVDRTAFQIFPVSQFIWELSRKALYGIPPVVFMGARDGLSYTGLSLYQLRQLYPTYESKVSVLSFGINRLVTGQSISLMAEFIPDSTQVRIHLSMMWGDETIHQQVRQQVEKFLGVSSGITAPTPVSEAGPLIEGIVSLPWERAWSEDVWHALEVLGEERAIQFQALVPSEPHKAWEEMLKGLMKADHWIVEVTDPQPERWFHLGIARSLGKKVILLIKEPHLPPPEYLAFPCVR
ncbi:MAG: hypothetical protein AAF399_00095, partial [Bacteroidota bacterium]